MCSRHTALSLAYALAQDADRTFVIPAIGEDLRDFRVARLTLRVLIPHLRTCVGKLQICLGCPGLCPLRLPSLILAEKNLGHGEHY